jgi:hypothetical protein
MSLPQEIQSSLQAFDHIILRGVPSLLAKNDTAFLSFMCMMAAIDALAAYRYDTNDVGKRFADFIKDYFPPQYAPHADAMYKFRCRVLHNFSPAYFTAAHDAPLQHLRPSSIGDTVLSDESLFRDLKDAAQKFFDEVENDPTVQGLMLKRLGDINRGGQIHYG